MFVWLWMGFDRHKYRLYDHIKYLCISNCCPVRQVLGADIPLLKGQHQPEVWEWLAIARSARSGFQKFVSTKTRESGWNKWPWAGIIRPDTSKIVWVWTQRLGNLAGTNGPGRKSSDQTRPRLSECDHRLKVWNAYLCFQVLRFFCPLVLFNRWTFQFR